MRKRTYNRKGGGQVFNPCSIIFFSPIMYSKIDSPPSEQCFSPVNLLAGHLTLLSHKQKE